MHLHAYLARAVLPSPVLDSPSTALLQYPNVTPTDTARIRSGDVRELLAKVDDEKVKSGVKAAAESAGKLEILDAKFKVIGERIVTPNAIVNLVFRAQVIPRLGEGEGQKEKEESVDEAKARAKELGEREDTFLASRHECEPLEEGEEVIRWAHAPRWPEVRLPSYFMARLLTQVGYRTVSPRGGS